MSKTAKIRTILQEDKMIHQGDIFKDIDIIENVVVSDNKVIVKKIHFPFVIILNQECDLTRDYENFCHQVQSNNKSLIHIIVAPILNFESFLSGQQWGKIFSSSEKIKRSATICKQIIDLESNRYHYLNFEGENDLPEFLIDFKHFFTINRNVIYKYLEDGHRLCSIEDMFKDKINQRFASYISRIGLPS